jgi:cilia- and flagella-associated protein 57
VQEMDEELQRYHKANAALDLTIGEQRLRGEGLQAEVLRQRTELGKCHRAAAKFRHDLHDVAQSIQVCPAHQLSTWVSLSLPPLVLLETKQNAERVQDPKELKDKIKLMYEHHVTTPVQASEVDDGVQLEYQRQRDYLEKTVKSLKNKLEKDYQLHRTDNLRIMQENVALLKEINELRREIKQLRAAAALGSAAGAGAATSTKDTASSGAELSAALDEATQLRASVATRDARIAALEAQIMPRPISRERLPRMEGFNEDVAIAPAITS